MSGGGDGAVSTSSILSSKLEKIEADRLNTFQFSQRSKNVSNIVEKLSEIDISQNGKNDSWQEDQEVVEIVNTKGGKSSATKYFDRRLQMNDAEDNASIQKSHPIVQSLTSKEESCVKIEDKADSVEQKASGLKKTEEIGTQTSDLVPYDYLLKDILNQRNQEVADTESRLSPTTILDRYVETCARTSSFSDQSRSS